MIWDMDGTKSSHTQPSELVFTPLLISIVGITCTALAILTFHFILTRYCIRRQQEMIDEATGVEGKILESIPVLSYSKQGGLFYVNQGDCVVCLGELKEGDVVRLLPQCGHSFHLHCIDRWFVSHSNCPLCRSPIMESMASESAAPVGVEEEGDGHRLQPQVHAQGGDIGAGSVSCDSVLEVGSNCGSLVLPGDRSPLRRSLSMDCACVSLKMKGSHERILSSATSSSGALLGSRSCRGETFRDLDHSMLQLQMGRISQSNQILPY